MSLNIGAIVLAAGFSTRFGDVKLCARLASGRTVLQQTLDNIQASIQQILIVTRPDLQPLVAVLEADIAVCREAENGMGTSLAYGVQTAAEQYDWDGCLVCLGDMPFIRPQSYRQIRDALTRHSIVIPCFGQRSGNPVGFGRDFFPRLAALSGDQGGRSLLQQYPDAVLRVELLDPAILQDIDTPHDLVRFQNFQGPE